MNYLSHLVGRALQLTQPLEPARGNPFEALQAQVGEPESADSESPEQQVTRRLRPVRMDAPAVVVDEPRETNSPTPAVARLEAVLAQAPVPRNASPDREPVMQPAPRQDPSTSAPQGEPAPVPDAGTRVTRTAEARTPATRWANASQTLRRPLVRTPLQPARAEHAVTTPEEFSAPVSPAAPRATARANHARERAATSVRPTASDSSSTQSSDGTMPASQPPVRRAPPLVPMARAMPPPAIAPAAVSAAPDVHISIGSVEIRTNTAPARAKPAAGQPRALRPSMTLADYLQKRRGGRG